MSTAVECVREIFPEGAIQTKRIDNPFRVTIAVQIGDKQPLMRVWTCKQHNLFQRNPKRRRLAMDSMKQAMAKFKEQMQSQTYPAPPSPSTSASSVTSSVAAQTATTNNAFMPEPKKQASLISL